MTHKIEDQLFKYATKEYGIGLLNFVKKQMWIYRQNNTNTQNLTFNPNELKELNPKVYKTDVIIELLPFMSSKRPLNKQIENI